METQLPHDKHDEPFTIEYWFNYKKSLMSYLNKKEPTIEKVYLSQDKQDLVVYNIEFSSYKQTLIIDEIDRVNQIIKYMSFLYNTIDIHEFNSYYHKIRQKFMSVNKYQNQIK